MKNNDTANQKVLAASFWVTISASSGSLGDDELGRKWLLVTRALVALTFTMKNAIVFLILLSLCVPSTMAQTISRRVTLTSPFAAQNLVKLKTPVSRKTASHSRFAGDPVSAGVVSPKVKTPLQSISTPSLPHTGVLTEEKREVARKIRAAFPNQAREMIAIAMAESGLRCEAINKTDSNGYSAVGLFQINDGRFFSPEDIANLTNCEHNIERARMKYNANGLRPWGVYWTKAYERYLWIIDQI